MDTYHESATALTFPARCEDCGDEFAAHLPPTACLCCGPCGEARAEAERPRAEDPTDAILEAYEEAYISRQCERAQEAGR